MSGISEADVIDMKNAGTAELLGDDEMEEKVEEEVEEEAVDATITTESMKKKTMPWSK